MHLIILLTVLALCSCTSNFVDPNEYITDYGDKNIIDADWGGGITDRKRHIAEIDTSKPLGVERICHSACNMYIGLPNFCTNPYVAFSFHKPVDPEGRNLTGPLLWIEARRYASNFPPELKKWYLDQIVAPPGDIIGIKIGSEMIRKEYVKECPS